MLGDAAHSIHPLAGLGANLGFADVHALVSELERAAARNIEFRDPQVLNRYQRSRRLDSEVVVRLMSIFRKGFADHGMHLNAVRNWGMSMFDSLPVLKKQIIQFAFMAKP